MIRTITVEREFGAGGAAIAQKLAQRLGWKLWDQNLTSEIAKLAQVDRASVERLDERCDSLFYRLMKVYMRGSFERSLPVQGLNHFDADSMVALMQPVIERVADEGHSVIVGRGSTYFLRHREDAFHVFIYAPQDEKIRRVRASGKSEAEAIELISEIDQERATFVQKYFSKEWPLREHGTPARWRIDADALARLVTPRTKLIIICNPNNPTGARVDAEDLDRIAAIAGVHGSWVLSDEIYRGAELDGHETPSMWGRSDRAIITSGLSKAYGLPGLRIGWIVAPPPLVRQLWSCHDYTTISPGALSDALARRALEPARRAQILGRTRRILNENFPVIAEWLDAGELFSYVRPEAGAIVYVRYQHGINSTELVTRLREQKSVLIVPGDHFGMDGYLRIGFGDETAYLRQGLTRLREVLEGIPT